jgi:uncharacterized membrane protein YhaH (DUF805 family)
MIPKIKPVIFTTVPYKKESDIESPYMVNNIYDQNKHMLNEHMLNEHMLNEHMINEHMINEPKKAIRWGRGKFIALYVGVLLGCSLLIMVSSLGSNDLISSYGFVGGMGSIFLTLTLFAFLMIPVSLLILYGTACRLRDIGSDPFLAFIFLIPVIGLLQALYLMFCPGHEGANDYGPDPRENDDSKLSTLDIVRNYATHKNINNQIIEKHEAVKKILKSSELFKIAKIPDKAGTRSKVVCVGFDATTSKYYLSVSNIGTPIHEFKKQYFLNYQLMSDALFDQTGLLIVDLANEVS